MVQTRSQTKNSKKEYDVNIDFDESSKEWMANKKSIGNGYYKYICPVEKNGTKCGKSCHTNLPYCWIHRINNTS